MCKHKYVKYVKLGIRAPEAGQVVKTYSDNVQHDSMRFRFKMDLKFWIIVFF